MTIAARIAAMPTPADGEDHMSPLDYQRIAALIGNKVGIKLPPAKRLMVEGRLRKHMRTKGYDRFDAYCAYLFKQGGLEVETPFLIDAVTTNKTDFFREPEHFKYLASTMVPQLIALRRGEHMPTLKFWSAASSNGAEAYTAAMVLADTAAERGDFRFVILGTDVSTSVLSQARRAVYSTEVIAPVPQDKQSRYIMQSRRPGARTDVRIAPELRRLTRFSPLNLMDTSYPIDRDVDIIFLRNVLIYFEKLDQEAVVARLIGHLRPRGYLVLGHSESMLGASAAVQQVAPAVFQKL